jgi:zinc transport system substrate-binding protein
MLALAALAALSLSSCGSSARADGKVRVVAAFYPLQFVTQQVGGRLVRVGNLVRPGVEPHDLELTPKQTVAVADADLVVYLHGFQPAVDTTVADTAKSKSLDVAGVVPLREGYIPLENGELHQDERGKDPHIWLDPTRLAAIGDAVAARLAKVDPAHASTYQANATSLRGKLATLDGEYRTGLKTCTDRTIVVSHNAFGYLSSRYQLTQLPITGLTPEEEPSATRLTDVVKFVRKHQVKVIFFETLVSPKIAKTIAGETGATARVLDPIEGLDPGNTGDYFSVMRANLTTLRSALGCT